ncbi:DUF5412 family protein [Lysinibacillus sp. KU-BSD001]|uniref:DUF5412 family protein n=1 Tax=Lysinibacillus sp. KU-BSD001 TaxID=3141328 RepID=UPI0036F0DD32
MLKRLFLLWRMIFALLLGGFIYYVFFDWSRFKDELIETSTSPNGIYTVTLYRSNGHATTPIMLLGELQFNDAIRRSKKIYWAKGESVKIEWLEENIVKINGTVLNVPKERYDFRSDL